MAISDPNEFLRMNRAGLAAAWKTLYKEPMPKSVGDPILMLALAYRLQAGSRGHELSPAVVKRLQQAMTAPTRQRTRSAKTPRYERYLREWSGEMHIVETVPHGFKYRDQDYRSLSEVARKITGTRWSGPLFFGVKKRSPDGRATEAV
jgi:hypothetical protein